MARSQSYYMPPAIIPPRWEAQKGLPVRRKLWGTVGGIVLGGLVLGLTLLGGRLLLKRSGALGGGDGYTVTASGESAEIGLEILGLSFQPAQNGITVKGYLHNRTLRPMEIPPLILSFIRQTSVGGQVVHRLTYPFTDPWLKPGETRMFSIPCEGVPENFSFITSTFQS